jgi:hypothetical protein
MTQHRLIVWYNTRCPVCDAGIDWQRHKLLAAVRAGQLCFRDINEQPQALAACSASFDDVRAGCMRAMNPAASSSAPTLRSRPGGSRPAKAGWPRCSATR